MTQNDVPVCASLVSSALAATETMCDGTGRNQACYGHVQVSAEAQPRVEAFKFDEVGDRVDVTSLRALRLSPMDAVAGTWGVALMRLQANLPDTAPGENVILLLFGDVEIKNAVPAPFTFEVTVAATGNANVRREPSSDAFVLGTLLPGTVTKAHARSEDGMWVYIELPDSGGYGWISTHLISSEEDISDLNAVKPYLAQAMPMQAFYLRTGDQAATCAEAPTDGLIIQTPEGKAEVRLWINEVKIRLGSTVFIQANAKTQMIISTLEGSAHVEALGVEQVASAGSSVTVQMNDNLAPAAPPSAPQPMQPVLQSLPIENLGRPITVTVAAPTADISTATSSVTETLVPTVEPTVVMTVTQQATDTPTEAVTPLTQQATDTPTAEAVTLLPQQATDTLTATAVPINAMLPFDTPTEAVTLLPQQATDTPTATGAPTVESFTVPTSPPLSATPVTTTSERSLFTATVVNSGEVSSPEPSADVSATVVGY